LEEKCCQLSEQLEVDQHETKIVDGNSESYEKMRQNQETILIIYLREVVVLVVLME